MILPRIIQRAAAMTFLGMPSKTLRHVVGPPRSSPDGLTMDLQTQALLWLMKATFQRHGYDGDLKTARRSLEVGSRVLATADVGDVVFEDRTVPGGAGELPARVYRPKGVATPGPGLVWFHGGGFVLGSIASHHDICRELARQAGVILVSVDYRLAPEHPFPAGLEDAVASIRWVLAEGAALGIDCARVAIGGDSAGGNLAAVASHLLRGEPRAPALQILAYPPTDATCAHPSQTLFADGFVLTSASIQWFLGQYVTDRDQVHDPRVSPLFAPDLSGLPPALVVTAGFDPLRDEGRAYAKRLAEARCSVREIRSDGSIHGFFATAGGISESSRVLGTVAEQLRNALSS